MSRTTLIALGFLGGALTAGLLPACHTPGTASRPRLAFTPRPVPRPVRAMWVARFHYTYPDDIRTIMANCAALGMNTVLWQVRGEATVAYPSRLEPWSREYDFRDPGFDPLAVAVEAAHAHGLRIEAWINVTPGWKGTQPPPVANHVYHAHPEWFMHDAAGRRQQLGDFYVILNPCLPEVRRHITAVAAEIAGSYAVDGIHLDYVRYAWDESPNAKQNYPRDARTLAIYRQETGRHPDEDVQGWTQWRANQLTRLVSQIRDAIRRARPGVALTAAVWSNPRVGYQNYLQNAAAWLRAGLIDAAMPMTYTAHVADLGGYLEAYGKLAPRGHVVPGIGLYKHASGTETRRQLEACGAWGGDFALFSYESLYPTAGDRGLNAKQRAAKQAKRLSRRAAVAEFLTAN